MAISNSPSKENESPLDAETKPNNPPSPTRSATAARGLSWQRRPNSQPSERPRSRPLSVVAAENATRSSNSASDQDVATDSLSRDQIASALSSKDPSWFRQTADRGTSSAAYRRNQVEDTQTVDLSSAQARLPGMSRTISGESFGNGVTPLLESPALRSTATSPTSLNDAQRLDPPQNATQSDIDSARETRGPFSPPLSRTSPTRAERSVSPTKGMGGFVQSAMMKRSESVSKRWNVQSPPALQRVDPVTPNRSSYDPANRTRSKSRPASFLRDTPTGSARPRSSEGKEADQPTLRANASLKSDTPASPDLQSHDSSKVTPPVSPSKTMDPRRWSPQKSSWLESALNKPESPKPKSTQPPSSQPAWMAELQRAKAQKAGVSGTESSKTPVVSHKHQVSIGGLLRSSAPGMATTPVVAGGLHSPSHSTSSINAPVLNVKPSESQQPAVPSLVKSRSESTGETKQATLPTVNKVKPATPPKKDFRANLKPRAPPAGSSTGSQDVEFKNVFGNLRRAATQNYVAPDELKNNITRGKAALAMTGGPQKSERVDEFKEAILAKKKEFQTTSSEARTFPRNNSVSSENPIPEGLLKRAEISRTNTITKRDSVPSDVPGTDLRRPSTVSLRGTVPGSFAGKFERFSTLEKRASGIDAPSSKPEAQGTSPEPSKIRKLSVPRPTSGSADQANGTNGPARLPVKIGSGGLANRFNPALAGLLSRGPPPIAANSGANLRAAKLVDSEAETNDNEGGSGPKLTHMTKNRARGPKRKAPTRSSAPPKAVAESPSTTNARPWMEGSTKQQDNPALSSQPRLISPIDSSQKQYVAPIQPRPKPITLVSASKLVAGSTASGETATERPTLESRIQGQAPLPASPQPPSPGKLNMNRMSRFMDSVPPTEKGSAPEQHESLETPVKTRSSPDKMLIQDTQQRPQQRSPSLNKPKVPLPAPLSLPPKRQSPKTEVGPSNTEPQSKAAAPSGPRPLPEPPAIAASQSAASPARPLPKEAERNSQSTPSPELKARTIAASPTRSPTKQSLETSVLLQDFFGSDRPQRNYHVDAAVLLMQRSDLAPPRIRTLSAQLFQFSADGKKQPVPAHHERTLFEHEMYLCTHSFNNEAGRKTLEVYFWAGDEVPEPVVQDAAVFVSREARSFGGKLINLRQGKETPEFLQALGGIVVTQRGSGNKYDSLAPHVLCGRRYHGHVVFDEVDFTSSALCSGFPYLITQGGRCYLWKGKGSSVDELSCARLIGMDYSLSGEMEEVEEGHEPATFWDLFNGANRFGSADHWRLKPTYDKYCSRLFLSDAASRQQVSSSHSRSVMHR